MFFIIRHNAIKDPKAAFGEPIRTEKSNCRSKWCLIITSTMLLLSPQTGTLFAETVIDDQRQSSTSGTIKREQDDRVTDRLNNINSVKYELMEVNDELKDIVRNPEQFDEETVANKPPPVIEEPTIVTKTKAPVLSPAKTNKLVERKPVAKKTAIIHAATPVIKKLTPLEQVPAEVLTATVGPAKTNKPGYNKHAADGQLLSGETKEWACVHDEKNGLMWEVKSSEDTLRNSNNLYTWFKSDAETANGIANGGRCIGDVDCDTNAYVQAMNKQNFCGYADWHLPTREEMQTLVYLKNNEDPVKINKQYFPETVPSWYWTASENNDNNNFAWYVLFRNGVSLNDLKERPKHIRLVRNYIQQ